LRCWRDRFVANSSQVAALGSDMAFQRMWEFYLAYAEAGFRAEYLNVWQFQLTSSPAS
jgi:cyclopropane-fatty-acyl-phospholipid synthase